MNFQEIRYEVADHVLTITLDRPDRLNAFTPTMARELIEAFDRADADDDVRAVIVTGAGRGFCAGADLGGGGGTFDWRDRDGGEAGVPRDGGGQVSLRIFDSLKPVIAAINGPAVGRRDHDDAADGRADRGRRRQDRLRVRAARDRAGGVLVVVPAAARGDLAGARVGGDRAGVHAPRRRWPAGWCAACTRPRRCVDAARALALEIADERGAGVGGAGAAADVDDARRRAPDGGPPGRLAGDVRARAVGRRARGRHVVPGEAAGASSPTASATGCRSCSRGAEEPVFG